MDLAFEMRSITKRFPGVLANDDVSFSARKGSVVCLIGENGAGKSTLMNCLYGMIRPDEGEILLDGKPVEFASSRDAMRANIGMVFQHFMLVEELSCLENIIIGMEPVRRGVVIDTAEARRRINAIMEQYKLSIPLDLPAGDLWVGLQQKLEILKTLYRGAEIIILDEPTAVLTPQETEELFVNIRQLARMGKTIVFITHKLDEVMQVADDIVVMRNGRVVARLKPEETDARDLAVHMVGKEIPGMRPRKATEKIPALELSEVNVFDDKGTRTLKDVSVTFNHGEILGVAGISGNGQVALAQVVSGLLTPGSGKVFLEGRDVTSHQRKDRIRDGISYIPEDRTSEGVCLDWTIEDNTIAGYQEKYLKRLNILDRKRIRSFTRQMISKFAIKTPDSAVAIRSLSGGNMQKVVVARETGFAPRLLIAAEPSRGVDVGAIATIHDHMIGMRNDGCAIILISSSLDEIYALSDRIAVMFEGEITAILDPETTTPEEIGLYMAGSARQKEAAL